MVPSGVGRPQVSTGSVVWPRLDADWAATRDAVHLWTQIVGKVRLSLEPMVNHWWQVPLYVSARGLTTGLMTAGSVGLEIEFDFVDHVVELRTTAGAQRRIDLGPSSVAEFYADVMSALDQLGVRVDLFPKPVEVPVSIPFAEDVGERPYDRDAVHAFWLALVQIVRVLRIFRGRFIGKVSPVHFFWGGFDLAVTRFSGRVAPEHPGGVPNCADWVQQIAYSHEVSSLGFWPGGSPEGTFYSYSYPEPPGFDRYAVARPAAYDRELGEFLLPYAHVRTAPDPDAVLLEFAQRTYEAAAVLGDWDRGSLEARQPA
jgi:hypothetical protein